MSEATRFGKYLLYERIAAGGMAEVFRAKPISSDRWLAVKRIHPQHLQNADFVAMLIDEAKISVQLDHPNIVRVLDLGKVDDHYFIAMEYIEGRDLRRAFEKVAQTGGRLPLAEGLAVVAQVVKGLAYAHARTDPRGRNLEIVHRDVSPQNVLLGLDGSVKLIDFGIAKAANRLVETQVGILKGKYAYMSPEQAEATGNLDFRSDIFSAGILLYECVAGRNPFRAPLDIDTLRNVKGNVLVPPREIVPDLPEAVERIVLRALSPAPADRYPTAGEMAAEIDEQLHEVHPGYSRSDLADFVQRLFAGDEPAIGPADREAAATPAEPSLRRGPTRLDRLEPVAGATTAGVEPQTAEGAVSNGIRLPDPTGPGVPDLADVGGGDDGEPETVGEEFRAFGLRLLEGRPTKEDRRLLGVFALAMAGLALAILFFGRPSPPAATGAELVVETLPAGAAVTIAGRQVRGVTPLKVRLPPGKPVKVTLSKPGYRTWSGTVVPGGKIVRTLQPTPTTATPPAPGPTTGSGAAPPAAPAR